MFTLRLAARNLWREPRRSVLTMSAVVAGVGFFILGSGFVSGVRENVIMAAIEGNVGHVQLRPKDYPEQMGLHPVDDLVELSPELRARLDREAVAWTERTLFAPTAATGRDSLRVVAFGYDPVRDPTVFPRTLWKLHGREPDPSAREIAVSRRVARLLELEPGARLVLQTRTHPGALNALEVEVSAVLSTSNIALDGMGIFVPAPLAQELVASERPSHVAIRLGRRDEAASFAAALEPLVGDQAEVVTWQSETKELLALQDLRQRALDIVMFVLMSLAAFGIANTILMAAHERVREIGTLRAMGLTERGVVGLFLLEGSIIGVLGSLIGALWGGALTFHWARSPIDFSEMYEQMNAGIAASALVYTSFEPGVVVTTVLLGVSVAALASVYPARAASRMAPGDAVRARE